MVVVVFLCLLLIASMLALSLIVIFRKPHLPGIVEERLDTALEVELIVESIERIANNE